MHVTVADPAIRRSKVALTACLAVNTESVFPSHLSVTIGTRRLGDTAWMGVLLVLGVAGGAPHGGMYAILGFRCLIVTKGALCALLACGHNNSTGCPQDQP